MIKTIVINGKKVRFRSRRIGEIIGKEDVLQDGHPVTCQAGARENCMPEHPQYFYKPLPKNPKRKPASLAPKQAKAWIHESFFADTRNEADWTIRRKAALSIRYVPVIITLAPKGKK